MKKWVVAFGGLKTFLQCPHKFYRTKISKDVVEEFNHPATIWGNEVHKALELYFTEGKPLGERFESFQYYADALAAIPGKKYIEHKLGMTDDSEPAKFFGRNVAYRGVIDYMSIDGEVAYMVDHKAGKVRPTKQLHFCALLIFANFPKVNEIRAAFYWLSTDSYTKHRFLREDIPDLWDEFEDGIVGLEEAQEKNHWPKKESGLCPWCPVKDCEHWGPR